MDAKYLVKNYFLIAERRITDQKDTLPEWKTHGKKRRTERKTHGKKDARNERRTDTMMHDNLE